jgi:signal peptidase II
MRRGRVVTILLLPALAVIALDQASKLAVISALTRYDSIPVIHGFFNLVHVRNRGIAFGLLSHLGATWSTLLLSATTVAAIVLLVLWVSRLRAGDHRTAFGLALIIGGAVGNLIDRLRLGEVVDFLDFYLGSFHWPAFNVADSAVTVGTIWVVLSMVITRPPEDKKNRGSHDVS